MQLSFKAPRNDRESFQTKGLEFGARFRAARNRLQLNRRQIAYKLGVNRETVGRWESGCRVPTAKMFGKLVSLLGPEILPDFEHEDLAGKMKIFRYSFGLTQVEAGHLARRSLRWWHSIECKGKPPTDTDQYILSRLFQMNAEGTKNQSQPLKINFII